MYPTSELTAGAVQDRRTLLNIIDQYRERLHKIDELAASGLHVVRQTASGPEGELGAEHVEIPLQDLREALK